MWRSPALPGGQVARCTVLPRFLSRCSKHWWNEYDRHRNNNLYAQDWAQLLGTIDTAGVYYPHRANAQSEPKPPHKCGRRYLACHVVLSLMILYHTRDHQGIQNSPAPTIKAIKAILSQRDFRRHGAQHTSILSRCVVGISRSPVTADAVLVVRAPSHGVSAMTSARRWSDKLSFAVWFPL